MNIENKNFLVPGAILLGFIILTAGIIWAFNTFTFRVGTIDTDRIIKESTLGASINKELQTKGKELTAKLQTAKTDAEKKQINTEFQNYRDSENKKFFDKVKVATVKIAKEKGIKAVSSPQVFIYSNMDLTAAVIAELDK